MPTYEYRCSSCGHVLEAFQRMSDAALTHCPNCDKEELKRIVSGGAGVIYRGEGWYVTDYSKKSSGGKDEPAKTSTAKADTPKETPAAKEDTTTPASKPVKPE
jgi:putative FmdB family regulatory protein